MIRKHLYALLLTLGMSGQVWAESCTLTVTDIEFGTIQQLNPAPTDVQGTVAVACQAEATDLSGLPPTFIINYEVVMDGGASGSAVARAMTGPAGTLSYNIYTDSGRQSVWGDGSNGTSTQTGQFTFSLATIGVPQSTNYISYARIPANINVAPGVYSDNLVTVTLRY
jgi:spore coat protein U-like protein